MRTAGEAASRAGVTVSALDSQADIDSTIALLARVWSVGGGEPLMTSPLARAFAHSGNYVAGAFDGTSMIGASVGFLGQDAGGVHLHSHITGVDPGVQVKGIGYALKLHQRAWALEKGMTRIGWTFDPLVSRNAYFNITKLGADITGFHANFYGVMRDGINREDESDRCVVSWDLVSQRSIDAANGVGLDPKVAADEGHRLLGLAPDGSPVLQPRVAETLLACIPRDIVAVRAAELDQATAWRRALRDAFDWAFQEAYRVTGMTKSGCYVLTQSA